MILLDKAKYDIVKEPLRQVSINNLFARSVVEKHITGKVYVNDIDEPTTFYVVHPYNMSLLFGATDNEAFNSGFLDYAFNTHKIRTKYEWMQAFPDVWNSRLASIFQGKIIKSGENPGNQKNDWIELNTRVNFRFTNNLFQKNRTVIKTSKIRIVRTDKKIFGNMPGSVVPRFFWKDADHFVNQGAGFSLFYQRKLASTAYSAFIHDDKLEIGIETVERFRGKGFAQYVCTALIDYCLENNFEPIWSCRLENAGSYRLAQRLGFEPTVMIPFYRLSN
jgi:GNAT superfamily N-acetyltransferase